MKITIHTNAGNNFTLTVSPELKIRALKRLIAKQTDNTVLHIYFHNELSNDEKTLRDYNIQDGSSLHVVLDR